MALDRTSLIELAKASAKASLKPEMTFAFGEQKLAADAINKTFESELNQLGGSPQLFRENQNLIFELIETALTEIVPAKVLQNYGQFADVKTYAQGDKPVFKVKISEASKRRAKSFVTKVGLAGRYETFKLDGYSFEVPTEAFGGAARVEWEELLDGRYTLSDYYQLVVEGMDEAIYKEIAASLASAVTNVASDRPHNVHTDTAFNETELDKLLQIADVYGHATIYCTYEFAATMIPQKDWASDAAKDQLWNVGAFTMYKGHNVIILPQSFEDATNSVKVIDPSVAYIIPTGSEKPVKVAFEGGAQVKQFDNRDWSTEIQTYQKVGVATYFVNPGICIYKNTSLTKEM